MSLLSQQDRDLTIKALECYEEQLNKVILNNPELEEYLLREKREVQTLSNWIKLEKFKNEN